VSSEWNRMTAVIFEGFEDVRDWMQNQGPAADVHRVEDMIRLPLKLRGGSDRKRLVDALNTVIKGCAVQRRIDKTEEQPPSGAEEIDRWLASYIDRDTVVAAWMQNVERLAAQVEGKRVGGQRRIPVLPECGVYCPRRMWDVIMMGRTPDGDLDAEAAAQILGFLRLLSQLSEGEAQYVRTYLQRRLESSAARPSVSKKVTAKAAEGFRKMQEAASLDELRLLFPRAFLPVGPE
jgi:hypothetical protein